MKKTCVYSIQRITVNVSCLGSLLCYIMLEEILCIAASFICYVDPYSVEAERRNECSIIISTVMNISVGIG